MGTLTHIHIYTSLKTTKMLKQRTLDVEDSNIANLGSDLHKKVTLAAAQKEPAWAKAGQKVGIEIWRIENFNVVSWPKDQYGKFFSGDSYIILWTHKVPDNDKLLYNVHFWIGLESSQDEYGTAAYKTVELDDFLGGDPVQYREVQNDESKLFMSYFSEFTVQEGGIDSGFNKVKPEEYRPRLLHLQGNMKAVTVREVNITTESLNSSDCFIFDAGMNLYQLNGSRANGAEKMKAAQVSRGIDDERKGKPEVHVFEEGDNDSTERKFWELMGGKKAIAKEAPAPAKAGAQALYRLSDASGKMEFKKEDNCAFATLDTKDVFVFDSGVSIFIWVGKGASKSEKSGAMGYATQYLANNKRSMSTPCAVVREGADCAEFKALLK